jgi:acyl-CoA thioesterase YciA
VGNLNPKGELALRVIPLAKDLNPNGDVFGGWLFAQVDIAGGLAAMRLAKGIVSTVAVNSMQFNKAVLPGDILSLYTKVLKVGRTSITVSIDVLVDRAHESPAPLKVTEAVLTYVAIDAQGNKRALQA